jgi:hypothetical protein
VSESRRQLQIAVGSNRACAVEVPDWGKTGETKLPSRQNGIQDLEPGTKLAVKCGAQVISEGEPQAHLYTSYRTLLATRSKCR